VIVVLTAKAETDLEGIAEYIARDSVTAALNVVHPARKMSRARRRAARLSAGTALRTSWHPQASVRQLPDFYRVGTETAEVVHILHGARDYEPLLFPEG
jgi:toxin ParE1/3/4